MFHTLNKPIIITLKSLATQCVPRKTFIQQKTLNFNFKCVFNLDLIKMAAFYFDLCIILVLLSS